MTTPKHLKFYLFFKVCPPLFDSATPFRFIDQKVHSENEPRDSENEPGHSESDCKLGWRLKMVLISLEQTHFIHFEPFLLCRKDNLLLVVLHF
jgi:hypothetical protein